MANVPVDPDDNVPVDPDDNVPVDPDDNVPVDPDDAAKKALDAYGNPGPNPPSSWWDKVRNWIKNYLEPLVPASQHGTFLLKVVDLLRDLLGG